MSDPNVLMFDVYYSLRERKFQEAKTAAEGLLFSMVAYGRPPEGMTVAETTRICNSAVSLAAAHGIN